MATAEPRLPLPLHDVEAACEFLLKGAPTTAAYTACIEHEQYSYWNLKNIWPELSDDDADFVIQNANKSPTYVRFQSLETFATMRLNLKKSQVKPKFKY